MDYKNAASGMFLHFLSSNLVIVIQFVIMIMLVRMLTVEEYGTYSLLFSLLVVAVTFLMPFTASISRYVPEYLHDKKNYLAKKVVYIALAFGVVAGVFSILFLFLFPNILNSIFKGESFEPIYLILFGFIILVTLLNNISTFSLIALMETKVKNIIRILYAGTFLLLGYFLLLNGLGITGVLIAILAGTTLSLIPAILKVNQLLFRKESTGSKEFEFWRITKYGILNMLQKLGKFIFKMQPELYLIGIVMGTGAAGLFAFSFRIPFTLLSASPAVLGAAIIFPFVVKQYTKTKNKGELSRYFRLHTKFVAFFTFPMVLGLIVLADPIIKYVFNPEYLSILLPFCILTISYAILSFRYPLENIYDVIEKSQIGVYSKGFFIIGFLANIYFVLQGHGILTVAIISTIATIASGIFEYLLTKRYVKLKLPIQGLVKMAVSSLLAVAFVLAFYEFITDIFSLLVIVLGMVVIYFVFSFVSKPFTKQDMETFLKAGKLGKIFCFFGES